MFLQDFAELRKIYSFRRHENGHSEEKVKVIKLIELFDTLLNLWNTFRSPLFVASWLEFLNAGINSGYNFS